MLAKLMKWTGLIVILSVILLPSQCFAALPKKVTRQKCTMKPIKVYYDALTEKKFTPTKAELEEAACIYKQMQQESVKIYARDNPRIYRLYGIIQTEYFPYEGCRCSMQTFGGEDDFIYFKILNTKRSVQVNNQVKAKVKKTIKKLKITKKTKQVDAVKKINKWICKNMSYDYKRAKIRNTSGYDTADYQPGILSKRGICGDYARAFTFLTNYCGIDSGCVINANVSHEYNVVRIAKKTYYMDVCYNDGSKSNDFSFLSKKQLARIDNEHSIGKVIWYGANSYYNTASCYED